MSAITIRSAPPPTVDDYKAATVAHLDAKARERGYDDRVSIATYVGSNDAEYASEARAFVDWRDSIWRYANAEFGKVLNGQRPQPSVAKLIAELPAIIWP